MKLKLKKLFLPFVFLLVFYVIYLISLQKSYINSQKFYHEPIDYSDFGREYNFHKYNEIEKIQNKKLISNKFKSKKYYEEINCLINGEYNINCLKTSLNQIYMPFSFVRNYFGVYGKFDKNNQFRFEHSYSKIYKPNEKYDYRQKFLWFESYSVENRLRVKFISGLYNVPFSLQWDPNGHFYPIQISQFGLSHFNKFRLNGKPKFIYLRASKNIEYNQSDFKNELKLNKTDFREIEIKSAEINNQINIDQLTNDYLNQTLTEFDGKLLLENEEKNIISNDFKNLFSELKNDKTSKFDKKKNCNEQRVISEKFYKEKQIYLNNSSIVLVLDSKKNCFFYNNLFLSFKFKSIKNLRITVVLINEKKKKFKNYYRTSNYDAIKNNNLVYGIGNSTEWRLFARDLGVDLSKSINLSKKKKISNSFKVKNIQFYRIIFTGQAILKNIKLSSDGHLYQFLSAVNWLLMKQDKNGGWPSSVNKRLVSHSLILNNNWYSSMSQGHSISLLIRAFHFRNEFNLVDVPSNKILYNSNKEIGSSNRFLNDELMRKKVKNILNNQIISQSEENTSENYFLDDNYQILNNSLIYLNAAIDAVNLFKKNVSQNGISAYFMDKWRFYEEFPTIPSLFVLNGFIFSLFGLYDLKMTLDLLIKNKVLEPSLNNYYLTKLNDVDKLYNEGISSLKIMLPLFDTGSSSLYDLRSFVLKVSPNIARWDYHCVHINLLLHLNTLLNDRNLENLAKRWIDYMKGKRAKHN